MPPRTRSQSAPDDDDDRAAQLAAACILQGSEPTAAGLDVLRQLCGLLSRSCEADQAPVLAALAKVATAAPVVLCRSLASVPSFLDQLLAACNHREHGVAGQAYISLILPLRTVAKQTPTAAASTALLLHGVLLPGCRFLPSLLDCLNSPHGHLRRLASLLLGLVVGSAAVHLTDSAHIWGALMGTLLQEGEDSQQGLSKLLAALDSSCTAESIAGLLANLAHRRPLQLLRAVVAPGQRRGLQHLLRALEPQSHASMNAAYALLDMARAPGAAPHLPALVAALLKAMRRGCEGPAKLVLSLAQDPCPELQTPRSLAVLMGLLCGSCAPVQAIAGSALWVLAHADAVASTLAAQHSPARLVAAMRSADQDAAVMAGVLNAYLAYTQPAWCIKLQGHLPALLAAAEAPDTGGAVASMACRCVNMVASRSQEGLAAVLPHAATLVGLMLGPHPEAAPDAGGAVLGLLAGGVEALASAQRIDHLLEVVAQAGPAAGFAARTLAHLAASHAPARALLAGCPARMEALHRSGAILEAALAVAWPDQQAVYSELSPVYWATAAAASCEQVPRFLPRLVAAMQNPMLCMPCFEAVSCLAGFVSGLLHLAPHLADIKAALSSDAYAGDEGLQAYLAAVTERVRAAVDALRLRTRQLQLQVHATGVALAHAAGAGERQQGTPAQQALAARGPAKRPRRAQHSGAAGAGQGSGQQAGAVVGLWLRQLRRVVQEHRVAAEMLAAAEAGLQPRPAARAAHGAA